jgi:hypothetical protein
MSKSKDKPLTKSSGPFFQEKSSKITRLQRTMVSPALRDSGLFDVVVVGTDGNCNFSAVRSPIELKLGDLALVSQISVHVLVSRFDYFLYCKQTKERKNHQNHGFTKLAFSPPFQVRLI